jgi:hypothetical protein
VTGSGSFSDGGSGAPGVPQPVSPIAAAKASSAALPPHRSFALIAF